MFDNRSLARLNRWLKHHRSKNFRVLQCAHLEFSCPVPWNITWQSFKCMVVYAICYFYTPQVKLTCGCCWKGWILSHGVVPLLVLMPWSLPPRWNILWFASFVLGWAGCPLRASLGICESGRPTCCCYTWRFLGWKQKSIVILCFFAVWDPFQLDHALTVCSML